MSIALYCCAGKGPTNDLQAANVSSEGTDVQAQSTEGNSVLCSACRFPVNSP